MKKHVTNLAGRNIYLDIYGNSVYYNFFDKNGYVITEAVEQKFKIFYHRYALLLIVMVLLGDYFNGFLNTLLVGTGAGIFLEGYFRMFYLKQLKVIKNFKRERRVSKLDILSKSKDKGKIIMQGVAYMLLSVLVVINAIQQNFNTIFMVLSGVIAVYSVYSGIINIVACSNFKKSLN